MGRGDEQNNETLIKIHKQRIGEKLDYRAIVYYLAKPSSLKVIEISINTRNKLAIEPFGSSPIESIRNLV